MGWNITVLFLVVGCRGKRVYGKADLPQGNPQCGIFRRILNVTTACFAKMMFFSTLCALCSLTAFTVRVLMSTRHKQGFFFRSEKLIFAFSDLSTFFLYQSEIRKKHADKTCGEKKELFAVVFASPLGV